MNDIETTAILPAETLADPPVRWQLPNFDTVSAEPPSAQQLESIEAAAYQDGYQRGYGEGFAAGQHAVLQQAQRLHALVEHIMRPLAHLDEEVERALVDLASAIARRLLRDEIRAAPERVVALVREALSGLPPQLRSLRLSVHPQDVTLLREHLQPPGDVQDFCIVADPELLPGDCRVVTESALVDARLDRRIRVIAEALAGDGA
ncbi:FliH/SctL family protein [Sinimarinibacterium thermocellulolyticum]|uniref:Flagellar assembly protein FliH n=1 Tax=Sinimarinibacterium thermocellulolyticum TaxID=3170016 RepID=A0ABV2ABB0_9GAMM